MLMHCDKFVIINTQKIEESLTPLVVYMNDPKNIDFDEDIINVIYLLIKHSQKLTPLTLSLIKNLYKYCDKVGGLLLDLYMLVNVYLAYGTEQILSNSEWFEGRLAVFNSGIKGHQFDKSPFFTCILIQT